MTEIINLIMQPWAWYVAGPMISLVMFALLYFGNSFGVSSNFITMCTIAGAGKTKTIFNFNWKSQIWNLVFIMGAAFGGFIANNFLSNDIMVGISDATIDELSSYGITNAGKEYIPSDIFSWESLLTIIGFVLIVFGGYFVGFGARYAGGCTSGHAISGLSDLQLSSLVAVVGFFIGGLLVTHFVFPFLLAL
jgi:uncharacterized membrane protein YedE/YeeE